MKKIIENANNKGDSALLILFSYHHNNTEAVAKILAKVLNAQIKTPQEIDLEDLQKYNLIGFGSGIYSEKHHKSLLDLVDKLPQVNKKKAFIFSTSATTWELPEKHSTLKKKLQAKGYIIVDEFNCKGFNTNSFLKILGGMNKGRPNAEDLRHAETFAQNMKQYL